MYLKWTTECYVCKCPLNPCIHTDNSGERILIRKYKKLRPIFTFNNSMYLKCFDTTTKRVCYACYKESFKNFHPSVFRDRECGRIKNIYPLPKSKTKDELLYWFKGLKIYLSKRLDTV